MIDKASTPAIAGRAHPAGVGVAVPTGGLNVRMVATGMLVVMAIIFVTAKFYQDVHPAIGFVRAFAEAAMVGGLADWFAVTALFRHPMGLPIPHTAIVPRNKNRIGDTLARFLLEHGADWRTLHGFGDDARGTLSWASLNEPEPGGDWLGCAQALVAHGMPGARPDPQAPDSVLVGGQRYGFSEEVTDFLLGVSPVQG